MTGKLTASVLGFVALAAALAGCGQSASQLADASQASSVTAAPQLAAPPAIAREGRPAGSQQAASAAAQGVLSAAALVHPAGKFFGIEADGAPDSLTPVRDAAASVGRDPNLVGQFLSWNSPFDATAAANTRSYGALLYMVWEPWDTTAQAIADGASDAYITQFATAVRDFGSPVALSFGHEMNGNWYPWGSNKTTAADFVAAWHHIHDLFAKVGANNVIWVWDPNVIDGTPDVQLEPYWPGAAYVDWVGVTGYFGATEPDTFDGIYGPTIAEIRQFTAKPIIIAETAVENGPNTIAGVRNLITGVETRSDVLGLVWFNYVLNGVDWTFENRPTVRAVAASSLAGMRLVSLGK